VGSLSRGPSLARCLESMPGSATDQPVTHQQMLLVCQALPGLQANDMPGQPPDRQSNNACNHDYNVV
jgi:hypothetical protein